MEDISDTRSVYDITYYLWEMKTRNIREVKVGGHTHIRKLKRKRELVSLGSLKKKKFPKISKDTLEETFMQVVTQLGAVNMRVDRLEEKMEIIGSGKMIMIDEDEEYQKLEKHHQNILDGLAEEDKKRKHIYNYDKSLLSDKDIDDMVSVYEAGYNTTPKKAGVDDSEEVEFSKEELKDMKRIIGIELSRILSLPNYNVNLDNPHTNYVNECEVIIFKLNKMLGEKE